MAAFRKWYFILELKIEKLFCETRAEKLKVNKYTKIELTISGRVYYFDSFQR